jgi:hypothetical protein
VAGVDEADWVKYDGKHWFVTVQPGNGFNPVNYASIEVVATDPDNANAKVVGLYQYDDEDGPLKDFYLLSNGEAATHLASVRSKPGNVPQVLPGWGMALSTAAVPASLRVPRPVNGTVTVDLIDVSTPSSPRQAWQAVIDGALLESRKIDNTLYLVTRFDPWLNGLDYEMGSAEQRQKNEALLAEADYADLVPHIKLGDKSNPLSDECLLQSDMQPTHGLSSLTYITAIDLVGQRVLSSQCINSKMEVLSMTEKSLYVTGTVYDFVLGQDRTTIHKFAVSEQGLNYKATGNVSGVLGWQADPIFKMHEYEGDFRIVTTHQLTGNPRYSLYILEESDGELKMVSVLPNSKRPDPIGKPSETIRSVRFDENSAYIVTFRQTDPLYKIDLSDRTDPKIAGELEISGFATYMHPVGDNYLFTLGYEANAWGNITGIKAELIDISGDAPVVVNKILLAEGSSSVAMNNLRAINILPMDDGTVRIAFPLDKFSFNSSSSSTSSSSSSSSSGTSFTDSWSGLKLLEIAGVDSPNAELQDAAEVRVSTSPIYTSQTRGLLHDDAVYVTFNSAIWAAFGGAPQDARGPILIEPSVCDVSRTNGLEVEISSWSATNVDVCKAKVTATYAQFSEVLEPRTASAVDNSCVFTGLTERPGFYHVTAELAGHKIAGSNRISVEIPGDLCHVKTQRIQMEFLPN